MRRRGQCAADDRAGAKDPVVTEVKITESVVVGRAGLTWLFDYSRLRQSATT